MKRLIISASLLILLVCICVFSYSQLKSISSELENRLMQCLASIEKEDIQTVKEAVDELNELWKNKRVYYKLLVDEELTDEIDASISSLDFFCEKKALDEFIITINDCCNTLRLILENERLSFEAVM